MYVYHACDGDRVFHIDYCYILLDWLLLKISAPDWKYSWDSIQNKGNPLKIKQYILFKTMTPLCGEQFWYNLRNLISEMGGFSLLSNWLIGLSCDLAKFGILYCCLNDKFSDISLHIPGWRKMCLLLQVTVQSGGSRSYTDTWPGVIFLTTYNTVKVQSQT